MREFTLAMVNEAIAAAVAAALPGVTVYDSPNQQNTRLPALFITHRGEQGLDGQVGERWLRRLKFDLCYLEELNLPDLGDRYRGAAEALDLALAALPYADGLPLRCAKRTWFVELDGLHYQFDLTARVSLPGNPAKMENLQDLKEGLKP